MALSATKKRGTSDTVCKTRTHLKLTKEAAQALVNLRGHPDFTVVLEWIAENRTKFRDECSQHLDDVKLRRAQGKVEVTDGIIKGFATAPAILEKCKSQL